MEFTLLASAAVAVGAFWLMLRWEAKRGNAAGCALDLWDAGLTAGAVGLLVGRLTSMVLVGINPLTDPTQIILVRSGVSTAGASIGAVLAFAFLARKALFEASDAIAPAVLSGLAGWHAGTLITGSWLGTVSDLPWAQAVKGSDITRHPVELYAAGLYLVAAMGIALWKQRGRPPLGAPASLALAAAGGVRVITEPMRISLFGGPVWLYVGSIVLGVGVATYQILRSARIR
ncbi:MAG: hypothetical protein BMS9Abin12_1522 [Acidimicrobiia bacterium]|nr:MAG: hypothetical protein BMS9Abin12_1522 [Acidimicrobiia bacterium]